jgi:sporulation protein YlmC with PRC-barrel domain
MSHAGQTPLAAPQTDRSIGRHRISRRGASAAMLAGAAFAFAASAEVAQAQAVTLVEVDVTAVADGFQTSKLLGKAVHNEEDKKIGTLDDIIITKDGKLVTILQVGGFLGLGGHLIAIPFESLNISNDGRKITLAGASKEAVGKLPEFEYNK